MREADIRVEVVSVLRRQHPDPSETLIVEELGVCYGEARVDIAAVNGKLAGFEIKSSSDTLVRLPKQVLLFSRVMDEMTLVCAERHLGTAVDLVPDWWGIVIAEAPTLRVQRDACPNPAVDAVAVLQLLWRNELVSMARSLALRGASRATRPELTRRLAVALSLNETRSLARSWLRSRAGWRVPR